MYGSGNPDNTQYGAWSPITWDATDLGGTGDCDLTSCNPKIEAVKIASVGDVALDHRFVGLDDNAVIKITLVEVLLATVKTLLPWAAATTPGLPAVGTRLYQYAKPLKLHPSHLPVATVTDNFNVRKTVPWKTYQIRRAGTSQNLVVCEFLVYPDRVKLAAGAEAYFYFGAVEA